MGFHTLCSLVTETLFSDMLASYGRSSRGEDKRLVAYILYCGRWLTRSRDIGLAELLRLGWWSDWVGTRLLPESATCLSRPSKCHESRSNNHLPHDCSPQFAL